MNSIFGWSLPPGCTHRHIDEAFGIEGPLDCPVCADGVEISGEDCPVCSVTTCAKHGCILCGKLEQHRKYCAGGCGDYLKAGESTFELEGKVYHSEACYRASLVACDNCGASGYVGICPECEWRGDEGI